MRKFGLNTISNIVARLWSMVAIYIFIPFYIHILGESAYGLVSFFATLHTALNLLGLGLANTLRREYAVGEETETNNIRKYKLLRSVELLYFGIGIFIVILCTFGSGFISNKWLNIEALDPNMVATVISLMGVSIAFQLIANLYAGCLFGLEHQVKANLLCVIWSIAKNVGALGVIALIAPDLRLFYSWHIVTDIAYLIALRIFVVKHLNIRTRGLWKLHDLRNISTIWKYTVGILMISLVALVNRQLDKVIISKFLTLTELGAYNASTTMGSLTAIIPAAIYTAIFPRFTKAVTTDNTEQLVSDFKMTNKIVNIVVVCMMAYIGAFAVPLIRIWTGSEVYADMLHVVGCLVVIAVGVTEFQEIPYALALAHGNTKINVMVGGIFIPIVATSTLFGIKYYGLMGAGIVYVVMALSQTLLYEYFVYKRYVDSNPVRLIMKDTILPSLFALASAFFIQYIVVNFTDSPVIQSGIAVICGGLVLCIMLFIFAKNELKNLRVILKRK